MESLEGKVVVVTGGGRGLGEATVRMLANHGALVIAADIRYDLVEGLANKLQKEGCQIFPVELNVTDQDQVADTVDQLVRQFGRIDILVNNAGTDKTLSIEELSIKDWDQVISVNLRGPFLLSKTVFPIMREQGGGQIVNITSTAAKRAWANASAYHASKWGLLGFSHALHVEGVPHHIKVTAIIAGGMRTPFLLDRFPDVDESKLQDPKNVAETIRFVLTMPQETVIPEMMVIPMLETSWP